MIVIVRASVIIFDGLKCQKNHLSTEFTNS